MAKNVIIFLPNSLEKNKVGYLSGFFKDHADCEAYYIVDDKVSSVLIQPSQCIGYVGNNFKNSRNTTARSLFISSSSGKISINDNYTGKHSVVEVVYDYKGFQSSDIREAYTYGKHFKILSNALRNALADLNKNGRKSLSKSALLLFIFLMGLILKVTCKLRPALRYSATFSHFENSITNLKWCLSEAVEENRITPKTGNILISKVVDIFIGIILLKLFFKYEDDIVQVIPTIVEETIANLKNLLLYLMGSPIGLKLNHSFNKSLGQFFFYHISLWKVFLLGTEPLLRSYLSLFVLPGALGVSFQVAMISDIISIATFHVYCIYVYAARLFLLQIRGLVSLWRLFIGRKYNPLRNRVDSCQYSQNQLFIGTLGFTILLFLLPTTAMYYAVFTTFRLVILFVDGLLQRVRYVLNVLPLYVITLWIFNSSSLAGTIYINWKKVEESDIISIEAKLNCLSLKDSIKKAIPNTTQPISSHSIGYIFHCMLTGVLI